MENASECKHSCTILQYSGQEVINAPIKKDDTMEYYKFAYKFSNSDNKGPIIYFFNDRSPFYKFLGNFIAIHKQKVPTIRTDSAVYKNENILQF